MKENTTFCMATYLEPHEYVIFVHSTKIGAHKNKVIHSSSMLTLLSLNDLSVCLCTICLSVYVMYMYVCPFQDEIQQVDGSLQQSCVPLMAKGEELVKCRLVQRNIASAVENLNLCLPGL